MDEAKQGCSASYSWRRSERRRSWPGSCSRLRYDPHTRPGIVALLLVGSASSSTVRKGIFLRRKARRWFCTRPCKSLESYPASGRGPGTSPAALAGHCCWGISAGSSGSRPSNTYAAEPIRRGSLKGERPHLLVIASSRARAEEGRLAGITELADRTGHLRGGATRRATS